MTLPERISSVRGQRRLIGQNVGVTYDATQCSSNVIGNSQCLCASVCRIQCEAVALAGCSDSAKRRMRVAPSRSCSIDVAYEMRR